MTNWVTAMDIYGSCSRVSELPNKRGMAMGPPDSSHNDGRVCLLLQPLR